MDCKNDLICKLGVYEEQVNQLSLVQDLEHHFLPFSKIFGEAFLRYIF